MAATGVPSVQRIPDELVVGQFESRSASNRRTRRQQLCWCGAADTLAPSNALLIDETWQTVGAGQVGALGAVAIPASRYNAFCQAVFGIKATVLGATEMTDSEIKGQTCFTKAAFKRQALHGDSYWLEAADQLFDALRRHRARTFAIWTRNQALLDLRNPHSTALSKPYRQLLFDLRAYMRNEAGRRLGTLNFDERAHREDEATARAVSNFLVRTSSNTNRWDRHFLTIPSFTASSISPGLQAADVVSYLVAHRSDRTARPELGPYIARVVERRYEYDRGAKRVGCLREVV